MSESQQSTMGGASKYAKVWSYYVLIYLIWYLQEFKVPPHFPETLRDLVREILRNQPKNGFEIYKFGKDMQLFWL